MLNPRSAERLLVDGEAIKARAPETAASFNAQLGATLSAKTLAAVQRVCSRDANVARRVERLIRDEALSKVTAAEVRSALPDAGLTKTDFGNRERCKPLRTAMPLCSSISPPTSITSRDSTRLHAGSRRTWKIRKRDRPRTSDIAKRPRQR